MSTIIIIVDYHDLNKQMCLRHRKPETEEMSGGARCCFGLLTLVAQVIAFLSSSSCRRYHDNLVIVIFIISSNHDFAMGAVAMMCSR